MEKPQDLPSYDLGQLVQRRRRIENAHLENPVFNVVLEGDALDEYVTLMRRTLNLRVAQESTLRETLIPFHGKEMTSEVSAQIVMILAGGFAQIRAGKPVRIVKGVKDPLWVPLELMDLRLAFTRNDKLYVAVTMMVLAGPPVGLIFKQDMPYSYVTRILARDLAWARFDPSPAHSELSRMWAYGKLIRDEKSSDPLAVRMEETYCAPGQRDRNRKLRKERAKECPKKYRWQCHVCPVGYAECPRGVHLYSWIKKKCKRCGDESIFDPAITSVVCLKCQSAQARKKRN